jgi:hypothetical protein
VVQSIGAERNSFFQTGDDAQNRRRIGHQFLVLRMPLANSMVSGHHPTIGTTRGTLLWHAIEHTLAHPPKEPKVTATVRTGARVGSAPGFWLIRKTDDKGKVVGIELREVLVRCAASGQDFRRYKKGDKKSRDRLLDACRKHR